jgi:hypothetical protein
MGRVVIWVGGIFAAVGLVLAVSAGWVFLKDRSFAATGVRAPGSVIEMIGSRDSDGDYTYKPVVEFHDAEGQRHVFSSTVSSSPPQYSTGEAVTVIYAPGSPDRAIIDSFVDRYLMPLIFGGLGTLFAIIGFGILFARLRARRVAAQLRASGLPIQAKVTECYRDTSVQVNGRSPWRVLCQATHPADGKVHSFTSESVWVDPSEQLAGKDVRVFVDPARPGRHLVDLTPYFGEDDLG